MDHGFVPTSQTLLGDLADAQGTDKWQEAWSRFAMLYGPAIVSLCRRYGVKEPDVEDVSQEVLLRLRFAMARFACRRWLKVVLERAITDLLNEPLEPVAAANAVEIRRALVAAKLEDELGGDQCLDTATASAAWARRLFAELSSEDEDGFAREWLAAGPAIWGNSRPSFPGFFGPFLTRSFSKWGLESALAQQAARALQQRINALVPALEEDSLPRFRSWLTVVVRNAAYDCLKQFKKRFPTLANSASEDEFDIEDDAGEFVADIERREIRAKAEERCRAQVSDVHWSFFCEMLYEGLTGPEIAKRHKTTAEAVYMAVNRVKKVLKEELTKLGGDPSC
jgi:DNA-directed RNA polymerase specialized sigma24 family protein